MDDDFKELDDKATYVTMMVIMTVVMTIGIIAKDTRIMLIGCVAVGVPLTFVLALLRHAWNERSHRRRTPKSDGARGATYDSPSTRRT